MEINKRDLVMGAVVAVGGSALATAATAQDQPHMDKAVKYLQAAKNELQQASRNKSGHRVKAIKLVDQAIHEVRAGKQAARS